MNEIRFSHRYKKLELISGEAMLILIIEIQGSKITDEFIKYDTDGGCYKIDKKENYLLLVFADINKPITFVTLRKNTKENYSKYDSSIGEYYRVVIENE